MNIVLLRVAMAVLGGAVTAWSLHAGAPRLQWRHCLVHGCAATVICLIALPGCIEYAGIDWIEAVFLTCLLYGLSVVDCRSLHVPLPVVFGGIGLRIASLAAFDREALLPMMLGLFAGAGMLALTALAYEMVRGRTGLGAGDTAVLGMIGCFVGWQGLVPALLGAALTGLIGGGAALLLLHKPITTPLPFTPFLAAGGWVVFVAQHAGWLAGALS